MSGLNKSEYPVSPKNSFPCNKKKQKTINIEDKLIKYTHSIPTKTTKIPLGWRNRFKVLLKGEIKIDTNIYLKDDKVVLAVLMINNNKDE